MVFSCVHLDQSFPRIARIDADGEIRVLSALIRVIRGKTSAVIFGCGSVALGYPWSELTCPLSAPLPRQVLWGQNVMIMDLRWRHVVGED